MVRRAGEAPSMLRGSRVETSARAAVSAFEGVELQLQTNLIFCNPLDLARSDESTLTDAGGNQCGCNEALDDCKVTPATLSPPEPLPSD
jgi:hypothetical protein